MSGWDWLGVCLMVPPLLTILIRLHGRWSMSLDRHIETALRQANGRCDCEGRLRDASGVVHTPTLCQPFREVTKGRGRR